MLLSSDGFLHTPHSAAVGTVQMQSAGELWWLEVEVGFSRCGGVSSGGFWAALKPHRATESRGDLVSRAWVALLTAGAHQCLQWAWTHSLCTRGAEQQCLAWAVTQVSGLTRTAAKFAITLPERRTIYDFSLCAVYLPSKQQLNVPNISP